MEQDPAKILIEKEWKAELAALHCRLDCAIELCVASAEKCESRGDPLNATIFTALCVILSKPDKELYDKVFESSDHPVVLAMQMITKSFLARIDKARKQVLEGV